MKEPEIVYKRYWKYEHDDKTTWKYLDFAVGDDRHGRAGHIRHWILNPNFKYRHLDPLDKARK
jgi:hypothetical protein